MGEFPSQALADEASATGQFLALNASAPSVAQDTVESQGLAADAQPQYDTRIAEATIALTDFLALIVIESLLLG
jgi:hypothetical protein